MPASLSDGRVELAEYTRAYHALGGVRRGAHSERSRLECLCLFTLLYLGLRQMRPSQLLYRDVLASWVHASNSKLPVLPHHIALYLLVGAVSLVSPTLLYRLSVSDC